MRLESIRPLELGLEGGDLRRKKRGRKKRERKKKVCFTFMFCP